MKQFSIHKVNKPVLVGKYRTGTGGADEVVDDSKVGADGLVDTNGAGHGYTGEEQPSLLSVEEQQALQPKEIKVVNPWIHEATHKEYLESVKVSANFFKFYYNLRFLFNLNLGLAGQTCQCNKKT